MCIMCTYCKKNGMCTKLTGAEPFSLVDKRDFFVYDEGKSWKKKRKMG